MFDSEQARAIRERVGEHPPITASERRDPEEAVTTLWKTWTDITAELQEFGVAPNAFCDAANQVAEARLEIHQTEGASSH